MSIDQRVGLNILRLRREKGLSQEELANKAGISRRYLSDIEHGKRQISLAVLERIARELGMGVGKMM